MPRPFQFTLTTRKPSLKELMIGGMEQKAATIEVEPLLTAGELEDRGILTRSSAYRLAQAGKIPSYLTGPRRTGVRFRVSEVLTALRRPTNGETHGN